MKFKQLYVIFILIITNNSLNNAHAVKNETGDNVWEDIERNFERTLESVSRIGTVLNKQFDSKEIVVTEKHREACDHILNESILSTLSETDLEGTDSDKKDMTLFFYLVRVKCLEIEGRPSNNNFTRPYFKPGIFDIDDEAECAEDIVECTNDYLGLLIVQFFKMFLRRMEIADLRRTFCVDYKEALERFDDGRMLADLPGNFTREFCAPDTPLNRRETLKQSLVRIFERYFGRMNSNELYRSICGQIIRVNNDSTTDTNSTNSSSSSITQIQTYYDLGIRIVGSCKLQAGKTTKWIPKQQRKVDLIERFKNQFDLYSKQLEEKFQSLSRSLQQQYESLRVKLLNFNQTRI